jgi:dephospho-CoA kinase
MEIKRLNIGLCAKPCAGKGTFVEQCRMVATAQQLSFLHVRFSDVLRDIAGLLSIPDTRENLQLLAKRSIDDVFGEGTLSSAVKARLAKAKEDVVVIDGVRWLSDEAMLRKIPGYTRIIYIHSSADDRFKRSCARGENSGEREKTLQEFLKEDSAPNEAFVEQIGSRAHIRIDNNGAGDSDRVAYADKARRTAYALIRPVFFPNEPFSF